MKNFAGEPLFTQHLGNILVKNVETIAIGFG